MECRLISRHTAMILNRIYLSNQTIGLFFKVMAWNVAGFVCAKSAWAVPVDLKSYDPACEVSLRELDESLVIGWGTPEGSTELTLNVSGKGFLVRSIAVARGKGKPVVVLRNADPVTVLSVGQRDLKKRGGWSLVLQTYAGMMFLSGLSNGGYYILEAMNPLNVSPFEEYEE